MKTITFRSVMFSSLLVLIGSVSFAATEKLESENVKITPVENIYLGKTAEKVWTINYSEHERPVTITMHQDGNEKKYLVRSEFFEVAYVLNKQGFGAISLPHSMREIPDQMNFSVLNKEQLKKQRILTPNQISEDYALGLIASYLPDLLNEGYKHLIY